MGISFDETQISLQSVMGITVSSIQPDTNSTQYVRVLKFYTTPVAAVNSVPVLIVTLYGGNQTSGDISELEIQTPTLEF